MNFFTEARRDIIARIIFDITKLLVPIALTSNPFIRSNLTRAFIFIIILTFLAIGTFVFPSGIKKGG